MDEQAVQTNKQPISKVCQAHTEHWWDGYNEGLKNSIRHDFDGMAEEISWLCDLLGKKILGAKGKNKVDGTQEQVEVRLNSDYFPDCSKCGQKMNSGWKTDHGIYFCKTCWTNGPDSPGAIDE